jgi:hypothetical protein
LYAEWIGRDLDGHRDGRQRQAAVALLCRDVHIRPVSMFDGPGGGRRDIFWQEPHPCEVRREHGDLHARAIRAAKHPAMLILIQRLGIGRHRAQRLIASAHENHLALWRLEKEARIGEHSASRARQDSQAG